MGETPESPPASFTHPLRGYVASPMLQIGLQDDTHSHVLPRPEVLRRRKADTSQTHIAITKTSINGMSVSSGFSSQVALKTR